MCTHSQSFGRYCQIAFTELDHFPLQQSMNENVFSHASWYYIESMFIVFIIWYFNDIGTSLPWLACLFPTEPSCEMTEQKHTAIALPRGMFDGVTWICHGTWGTLRDGIEHASELYQPEVRKLEYFSTSSPSTNWLSTALRLIGSDACGSACKLTSCPARKAYGGEWQVFLVFSEVNAEKIWMGHQPYQL